MYNDVTIIMPDKSVSVDGVGTQIDIVDANDEGVHAIQWHNGSGHVEFSDELTPNILIQGQKDYESYVLPYVRMWEERDTSSSMMESGQESTAEQRIKNRLLEIDLESVRPLRAKVYGTATPEDDAKLAALEQEAEELREELAGVGG